MDKQLTIILPDEVSLDLILVEPGFFIMGSEAEDAHYDESPEHIVEITQPFYIGKYPITNTQWQAVMMDDNESSTPGGQRPVEGVSWFDIMHRKGDDDIKGGFMSRLNVIMQVTRPDLCVNQHFRLPTEAEWEYAAKGGPTYSLPDLQEKKGMQLYPVYAGSDRMESCGWSNANNYDQTRPVGLKIPNELGLYDLSGNVRERCSDRVGKYIERKNKVTKNPGSTSNGNGSLRGLPALRGGYSSSSRYCRVTYRDHDHPTYPGGPIGFRVVLALS